ncbi:TPA: hypothetical protein DEB00_02855 [Candidatus Uhrbacteria bacterium]|nr:hypothetical protein [Candidatus Uhrbacteria bacterium]
MAPKKTPSPAVPFWRTVEDMIGQQVGHAAGKGLSHLHIISVLVSMMDDKFLAALKLAGPSLTAGVGKTAFQVLKGRIPVLKNLADPVLEEAMEGLLNGFFYNLSKFPGAGATDAQARMALLAAANESMIAHAPVSGGAVKPGSFVLSDAVLEKLEERYDEDSVKEILAWYCHGVSCLARAALDMNVQDSLAVEAGMAFNHGDFSSVVSVITFVETAKKHQGSFEDLVYACAAVVQANTAADHSGMRTTFMARRLLARGLNWLGVNGTRQNFMNVVGHWIAPGLLKDGQFVAFLLVTWAVAYVATAVPWFYAASNGSVVGMFVLASLNMIVTQFSMKLLGLVVGVHTALYRAVLGVLGQGGESSDRLPALQAFRAQASSPLLVATVLNCALLLFLGATPRAFNGTLMILMATIAASSLISLWDMAKTSHARQLLDAGIKYLLPVLLVAMAWDVWDAYTQSQLPGRGMRLMGHVHDSWSWATNFSMGQAVTGGLTLLLVIAVALALKQGKVWHAIALVVIAVPLSWIVDCSVSAPKRAEDAQEQRAQEHALQLETLRVQREVAEAGKTTIIVGDPVLAMRQLGGPTRQADIALRVPREGSAATEREEIVQIEEEEEWEEDLETFEPERPNIREILREREERAQRTAHNRPRPSSRRTSAHHHRAQRNARR